MFRDPEFENRFSMRYFSPYRGKVVDVNDPKKLNRIKVYVPAVHKVDISTGEFAVSGWSWPFGAPYYKTPKVGSEVWVQFEEGDVERPVWSPGPWTYKQQTDGSVQSNVPNHAKQTYDISDTVDRIGENSLDTTFEADYGSNVEIIGNGIARIEFDETEGATRLLITHKSGTRYEIRDDGSLEDNTQGNRYETTRGSKNTLVSGGNVERYESNSSELYRKGRDVVEEGRSTYTNNVLVEQNLTSRNLIISGPDVVNIYNQLQDVQLNKKVRVGNDYIESVGGARIIATAGGLFSVAGVPSTGIKLNSINPAFSVNLVKGPFQPEGVPFVFPGANIFSTAINGLVNLPGVNLYSSVLGVPTSFVNVNDGGIALGNFSAGVGSGIVIAGGIVTIGSNATVDVPIQLAPQPLTKYLEFQTLKQSVVACLTAIAAWAATQPGGQVPAGVITPAIAAIQAITAPTTSLLAA